MEKLDFVNPFETCAHLLGREEPSAGGMRADITWIICASSSMRPLWQELHGKIGAVRSMFEDALGMDLHATNAILRLRMIAYRDLYMDSCALEPTSFLEIPKKIGALKTFVRGIEPMGGGVPRKSGLEALYCAIHGPWRRERDCRHILCLIADSGAYLPDDPQRRAGRLYEAALNAVCASSDPCESMPLTLDELRRVWRDGGGDLSRWNSRLALFAPPVEPWEQIARWPRTTFLSLDATRVRQLKLESIVAETCRQIRGGTLRP